jgi:MOSC domain-containing protein YiiM
MMLLSVSVGGPREVSWNGETVPTSIWKSPVAGPVRVGRLNLEGDRQSDLTVHGGEFKAVYAYPVEHYPAWRLDLGVDDLPHGAFGENLTVEGLLETGVRIGDRLAIGTAEFVVTQPRMPCFKLGIRHGRPDILKRMITTGRNGFYLSVAREGRIEAGEAIAHTAVTGESLTVAQVTALYGSELHDLGLMRRAAHLAHLAPAWRDVFRKRLAARGDA